MPKGQTRHVPNHEQRAAFAAQSHWNLQVALANLTPAEYMRYEQLLAEAGNPENLTDRAAILDRAKAYVRSQARAESEANKTEAQNGAYITNRKVGQNGNHCIR